MVVTDLDTPTVIIDLDIMENNIARMAKYCQDHGLQLRPHIKTHKTPEIAQLQMEAGACGIACQKLGEAEVMVEAGLRNILICYNLVGQHKLERLARLAAKATLSVALDSAVVADGINWAAQAAGQPIGVLIELEAGAGRTGVQGASAALDLAQHLVRLDGLEFRGLLIYPTNLEVIPLLEETVALLRRHRIPVDVVSGGGTTAVALSHQVPHLNEVRVGNYVFNDLLRVRAGVATPAQCALRVLVTVVSVPTADQAVIDGGWKTFTNDVPPCPGQPAGLVLEDPGLQLMHMTEEHGVLITNGRRLSIGDRLTVIPNHACGVVNLHDRLVGVRGGQVEVVWEVKARGKTK